MPDEKPSNLTEGWHADGPSAMRRPAPPLAPPIRQPEGLESKLAAAEKLEVFYQNEVRNLFERLADARYRLALQEQRTVVAIAEAERARSEREQAFARGAENEKEVATLVACTNAGYEIQAGGPYARFAIVRTKWTQHGEVKITGRGRLLADAHRDLNEKVAAWMAVDRHEEVPKAKKSRKRRRRAKAPK